MNDKIRENAGFVSNAMLVSLVISQWYNTITDQEITDTLAVNHKAKKFAISVRKQLLAKRGAVIKVQAALTALRSYHNAMTLPWSKGIGIIKSSKYTEYSAKIRQLITEVNIAVQDLVKEFPALKTDAKDNLLGDLYKDSDYPDVLNLKDKFNIKVDVVPVPKKGDWRIDLVGEELDKLDQALEEREKERTAAAMKALWERLYNPVKHMVEVLGKDNPKIYNTLITNISNLTEILPDLNILDDPELNKLGTEIEEKLCDSSIEELRKSPMRKKELHESAESLKQKIKKKGKIQDDNNKNDSSKDDSSKDDNSNDDAMAMMSGYANSDQEKQDKVINEFGRPVTGQRKIKMGKKK